ncbi:MAG: RNA polymerase sigma factor [Candidatus Promineifilaceae bacterium]
MRDYKRLTDVQLVGECRKGNGRAWEALVQRYRRLIYTVPLRSGLSQTEADDVFQSVWLILLRHLDDLNQPERVSAWLVTTTRRETLARRRKAEARLALPVAPLDMPDAPAADEFALAEETVARYMEAERLRHGFEQLGERCQQLLRLLYFDAEQPSYVEIAARLEMPVGAIGPNRARCLERLRHLMEQQ